MQVTLVETPPPVTFGRTYTGSVSNAAIPAAVNVTPPAAFTPFFGLLFGDTLYTGTPSDNTVTNSKIVNGTISYSKFSTNTQATLTANQIIFGV